MGCAGASVACMQPLSLCYCCASGASDTAQARDRDCSRKQIVGAELQVQHAVHHKRSHVHAAQPAWPVTTGVRKPYLLVRLKAGKRYQQVTKGGPNEAVSASNRQSLPCALRTQLRQEPIQKLSHATKTSTLKNSFVTVFTPFHALENFDLSSSKHWFRITEHVMRSWNQSCKTNACYRALNSYASKGAGDKPLLQESMLLTGQITVLFPVTSHTTLLTIVLSWFFRICASFYCDTLRARQQ